MWLHTSESSSYCVPPNKASCLLLRSQCGRKDGKKGCGTALQFILWLYSLVTTTEVISFSVSSLLPKWLLWCQGQSFVLTIFVWEPLLYMHVWFYYILLQSADWFTWKKTFQTWKEWDYSEQGKNNPPLFQGVSTTVVAISINMTITNSGFQNTTPANTQSPSPKTCIAYFSIWSRRVGGCNENLQVVNGNIPRGMRQSSSSVSCRLIWSG